MKRICRVGYCPLTIHTISTRWDEPLYERPTMKHCRRNWKTFFGFAKNIWNSFISCRGRVFWFWRISCNRSFFIFLFELFELYNHQLLTLVNDPKQFDYSSIRDDHKLKVHILQSLINNLLGNTQYSYHKKRERKNVRWNENLWRRRRYLLG